MYNSLNGDVRGLRPFFVARHTLEAGTNAPQCPQIVARVSRPNFQLLYSNCCVLCAYWLLPRGRGWRDIGSPPADGLARMARLCVSSCNPSANAAEDLANPSSCRTHGIYSLRPTSWFGDTFHLFAHSGGCSGDRDRRFGRELLARQCPTSE